jgi:stage IV sporulation protein B
MIIRITDRDLLSRTGGILHGMSGSPIIQDGKLAGVLTHATTGDPAKGYAVYIDFVTI